MLKKVFIAILCLSFGLALFFTFTDRKEDNQKEAAKPMIEKQASESKSKVILTTLFDNYEYDSRLRTGWGFSCLVDAGGKKILFDTGTNSITLLSNMEKLDVEAKGIDTVVLSHIHDDHIGGLWGFLEKNSNVNVYLPASFPDSMRKQIQSYGASYADIASSTKISESVYSTGELGVLIKEQSLLIDSAEGLVILTGCAHPGITNIIGKAKEIFPEKEIYLVTGGFHLVGASDRNLQVIVDDFKKLGVKKVAPCHCSGDKARELFKETYQDDFIESGVGKVIII